MVLLSLVVSVYSYDVFSPSSPGFLSTFHTQVEWLWTQCFPDLARPMSTPGTSTAIQPAGKVLRTLDHENTAHLCKKVDIDRWCEAVLNSGVTRGPGHGVEDRAPFQQWSRQKSRKGGRDIAIFLGP